MEQASFLCFSSGTERVNEKSFISCSMLDFVLNRFLDLFLITYYVIKTWWFIYFKGKCYLFFTCLIIHQRCLLLYLFFAVIDSHNHCFSFQCKVLRAEGACKSFFFYHVTENLFSGTWLVAIYSHVKYNKSVGMII